MAAQEFILTSDGGSDERSSGAGACILRLPAADFRLKLIGMLGPMSGSQAELAAALIGWGAIAELTEQSEISVQWLGDNEALLNSAQSIRAWRDRGWRTSSDRPVANRGLWEAFIQLSDGHQISTSHIRAHSGHRENEACDRAARWIQRKGEKLLAAKGPGRIGQLAKSVPGQAWTLIDARAPIRALLDGGVAETAVRELRELLRPHLKRKPEL